MTSIKPPFFLLGVQRSGTTLIRMLLDQHSEIAIPFESMVLIEFYHHIHKYNILDSIEDRKKLVKDLVSARGISGWNPNIKLEDVDIRNCNNYSNVINEIFSAYKKKCGKSVWGDKTPSYTQDFHILNELFPAAKFIHIIRDGRDVALSLIKQAWGPITFDDALEYWADTIRCSRKMGRLLSKERYLEVRFEDFVEYPKENVCKVLEFLSLNYEEGVLNHDSHTIMSKLPPSSVEFHGNLKRPIDASLALKWKKSLSMVDQALAWRIAGDIFNDLDYPSGNIKVLKLLLHLRKIQFGIIKAIYWRVKKIKAMAN